ncbi:MAG: valine--tRNA ligase [Bdellovibrionaceae bacterium]|jgi:valyl-tRNA synthetase|nr:valine--tRNA ligase [Pseudobdellovibrionaceae bacterium]
MSQDSTFSDRYAPQDIETKHYKNWEESGYFKAEDQSTKPPYCIILPPPNVTGVLHLGHALDFTLQDVLIRWKRMSGFNALWMPGADHAGIATQSVVEKELRKEGVTRHELGREKFVEKIWDWKHAHGERILEQMKCMGFSCDWDRQTFTLDEGVSKAVRKVFTSLYKKGAIYRGNRLINWSPKLESALSDLEVNHIETKGNLWHIKYPLADGSDFLIVATTRPETLLGDTAVCVHPNDERYESYIGKEVSLPLTDRKIKIIADEYVDKDFGSGVVKITPAHDFNDYEIGKRHELEFINLLNKNGTLNENAGENYKDLSAIDARKKVVADLEELGLLEKVEPHAHSVGHCERSGCVVEPLLSDQWFVDVSNISVPAKRVVESGTISFEPESWTKTYLHWMNNLQDWCISRQLWWGHRIPAWYCKDCSHVTVIEESPSKCEGCKSENIYQEEDVLDTWFSSALWPFSTLGWPEETESLKTFYPTNVLITGHDIIFFWVARMIMMGLEFQEDVPFRKVYLHGLLRDDQGRKLSKSLKNAPDPLEIVKEYGADALRATLMSQVSSGRDLKFSMQKLETNRNFLNKIWNATRFALGALTDFDAPVEGDQALPQKSDLSDADQWIIHKLKVCEKQVDENLRNYKFSEAFGAIYAFVWHELCDWYLELSKPILYGEPSSERTATQLVLTQVLNRALRLLHPFAPFITEELYQKLPIKNESIVVDSYPNIKSDKVWLEVGSEEIALEMDLVISVISAIRNIRGENRIKPSEKIKVMLSPGDDKAQKILGVNKVSIMTIAGLSECIISEVEDMSKCAVTPVRFESLEVDVVIPLEGLVDFEIEITRINKNIEKLEKEELSLSKRMNNENFLKNAPEEVVDDGKLQLVKFKSLIESLRASLKRLQS